MANIDTQIESLLDEIFDKGNEAGGDIVLERQFENDPEAYSRYRARVIKEAHKAIKTLLDTAVQEARIELATDLLRKVKLEYEAGGRYSGHIILPWEEVVRPELVKLKSTSKEDK